MRSTIEVKGARENNLRNVHLEIPRDKLVVVTGVSGSGKSSLAFDTVYAEGQRRFMESLSTFARQFVSQLKKPDVDFVNGLSPVISIEQKTVMKKPEIDRGHHDGPVRLPADALCEHRTAALPHHQGEGQGVDASSDDGKHAFAA